MSVNADDIVDQVLTMNSHDVLLLFTNRGKVYRLKGYRVPQASRTAKGLPVVNLLNLDKDEQVKTMVPVQSEHEGQFLFFVTKRGLAKRVHIREFDSIRQTGKIAIGLKEDDELLAVKLTTGEDEIIIGGSNGKAVRFAESAIRAMGRTASGVRGFNVNGGVVIGMATNKEGAYILSVTQKGYGKKSELEDYRITNRGAKGVKTINITEKNGPLVALKAVNGDEDLLMVTEEGTVIRISLDSVGVYSRGTQGVKLINVQEDTALSMIAVVDKEDEEEEIHEETSDA